MAGFRSITPNININTESGQLRTELQNTFARLDGQLNYAPYRFAAQNGPVSCTGSAETDLMSTTINYGTFNKTSQSMLIFACGQTAANANNKTLKFYLGSSLIFNSGAIAMNNVDWTLQAEIIFGGGTSQITWAQFCRNNASPLVDTNTLTENFANNLTMKFTGQGSATGDISIYYYKAILIN